ncbi:hypothetical protein [Chromobacterium violaceum]|uniref:hypothetical protein n=1 Tax=Chromobacterium violaceum TaxID=536 RepID=UPI001CE08CAE|nr:hypothetical protein [Chromobacterium violaceum]
MVKNIFVAIAILFSFSQNAAAFNEKDEVINRVSQESIDGLKTPEFIQYYQKGRRAPSCSLVNDKQVVDIISFDEGSDDDYSNCSEISKPIITKQNGKVFATYPYTDEQTKGELISSFATIELDGDNFRLCSNSDDISEAIRKSKKPASQIISRIIKKKSCN